MAKSVKLQVITPDKLFYEGDIELVIVKTLSGEEGFMANHSWACKLLDISAIFIREAGSKEFLTASVSGGFVDIMEDIIIYTDAAEWATEIDTDRAFATKAEMEAWLSEHEDDDEDSDDVVKAKERISRQKSRIRIAQEIGQKRR